MSSSQQFLAPKLPQQQIKQITITPEIIHSIKEKLKEFGPGPYTPEQQKQKDNLQKYLNYENQSTNQISSTINQQQHQQQQQQQQQQPPASSNESTNQAGQQGQQQTSQILDKRALQDLVKEVDPTEQLDEDVEDLLLQVADDFIENIISNSCQLAKHRKSNILEVKDVQFHLERNFNLWIPGFSTEDLKPFKKSYATEAHKQRLMLIKKSSKPVDPKDRNKD